MRNRRPPTNTIARDTRGVSTALGYVLTLSITAILISGLLIAGGTLVKNEREVVARDQLAIAGEQLATGLTDADQLASTTEDGTVRVEIWLPRTAGGSGYSLRLEPQTPTADQPHATTLIAESGNLDVSQSVTVRTSVEVAAATFDGGPVVVRYVDTDSDGDRELLVEDARQAPQVALGGALPPASVWSTFPAPVSRGLHDPSMPSRVTASLGPSGTSGGTR